MFVVLTQQNIGPLKKMAWNTEHLLSGIGLYLLAIAILYGRHEVLPKDLEKTDIVKEIYKAPKREGTGEAKLFRTNPHQEAEQAKGA